MRQIRKGPEPASLTAHRQTPHSNYGNYQQKEDLRSALVQEQGSICCYCMCRIRPSGTEMKVEHWRNQDNYPSDQLAYPNLLGGCRGGEGNPRKLQHCDTRKAHNDLQFNPADPDHHVETRLSYGFDGSIEARDDASFNQQLDKVLNLNLPFIKNNRRGILLGVLNWWKEERRRLKGPIPKARFEFEIARHTNDTADLTPYCQVAVWWLKQKIARMAP